MYIWKTSKAMRSYEGTARPIDEDHMIPLYNLEKEDFAQNTEYLPIRIRTESKIKNATLVMTSDSKRSASFDKEKARILDMVIERNLVIK